jgi:hypothetical protein
MASLPNRILRLLVEQPSTPAEICDHFPAYTLRHTTESVARIQRLGLAHTDQVGRLHLTPAGHAAATMANPPRWSPRRSSPRTATIA